MQGLGRTCSNYKGICDATGTPHVLCAGSDTKLSEEHTDAIVKQVHTNVSTCVKRGYSSKRDPCGLPEPGLQCTDSQAELP